MAFGMKLFNRIAGTKNEYSYNVQGTSGGAAPAIQSTGSKESFTITIDSSASSVETVIASGESVKVAFSGTTSGSNTNMVNRLGLSGTDRKVPGFAVFPRPAPATDATLQTYNLQLGFRPAGGSGGKCVDWLEADTDNLTYSAKDTEEVAGSRYGMMLNTTAASKKKTLVVKDTANLPDKYKKFVGRKFLTVHFSAISGNTRRCFMDIEVDSECPQDMWNDLILSELDKVISPDDTDDLNSAGRSLYQGQYAAYVAWWDQTDSDRAVIFMPVLSFSYSAPAHGHDGRDGVWINYSSGNIPDKYEFGTDPFIDNVAVRGDKDPPSDSQMATMASALGFTDAYTGSTDSEFVGPNMTPVTLQFKAESTGTTVDISVTADAGLTSGTAVAKNFKSKLQANSSFAASFTADTDASGDLLVTAKDTADYTFTVDTETNTSDITMTATDVAAEGNKYSAQVGVELPAGEFSSESLGPYIIGAAANGTAFATKMASFIDSDSEFTATSSGSVVTVTSVNNIATNGTYIIEVLDPGDSDVAESDFDIAYTQGTDNVYATNLSITNTGIDETVNAGLNLTNPTPEDIVDEIKKIVDNNPQLEFVTEVSGSDTEYLAQAQYNDTESNLNITWTNGSGGDISIAKTQTETSEGIVDIELEDGVIRVLDTLRVEILTASSSGTYTVNSSFNSDSDHIICPFPSGWYWTFNNSTKVLTWNRDTDTLVLAYPDAPHYLDNQRATLSQLQDQVSDHVQTGDLMLMFVTTGGDPTNSSDFGFVALDNDKVISDGVHPCLPKAGNNRPLVFPSRDSTYTVNNVFSTGYYDSSTDRYNVTNGRHVALGSYYHQTAGGAVISLGRIRPWGFNGINYDTEAYIDLVCLTDTEEDLAVNAQFRSTSSTDQAQGGIYGNIRNGGQKWFATTLSTRRSNPGGYGLGVLNDSANVVLTDQDVYPKLLAHKRIDDAYDLSIDTEIVITHTAVDNAYVLFSSPVSRLPRFIRYTDSTKDDANYVSALLGVTKRSDSEQVVRWNLFGIAPADGENGAISLDPDDVYTGIDVATSNSYKFTHNLNNQNWVEVYVFDLTNFDT